MLLWIYTYRSISYVCILVTRGYVFINYSRVPQSHITSTDTLVYTFCLLCSWLEFILHILSKWLRYVSLFISSFTCVLDSHTYIYSIYFYVWAILSVFSWSPLVAESCIKASNHDWWEDKAEGHWSCCWYLRYSKYITFCN